MSDFQLFMKQNKVKKENQKFAATRSLQDENGNPVLWEFRPIPSREVSQIREECVINVPIKGKPGAFRREVNGSLFTHKLACKACVFPDLRNAALQDSYGVTTPEELLYALVDDAGEYTDLLAFVQKMNGFDVSLEDKVDEAKN